MENYFYKCNVCGYVHLVPAYWVSFNPEETIEQVHMNLKTGECCPQNLLILMENEV